MTIQTNTLSERPSDEWWYALPANQTQEERIKSIQIAIAIYECRFGHLPDVGNARSFMIGLTPILAYPIPVVNISIELQPEPQSEPEPTTMEVW